LTHREGSFEFDPARPADYKPLEAYGVIGDGRTAVLAGADGSIDWACLPDFDRPSVFGALLDPDAGVFSIRPRDAFRATQRYERGTNVLVTEFETATGEVRLREFMPYTSRRVPTAEIYRRLEGVRGAMDLAVVFEPRFDYGRVAAALEAHGDGVLARSPHGETIALVTEVPLETDNGAAHGSVRVEGGSEVSFVADWGARRVHPVGSYQFDRRLWQTRTFWRSWVEGLTYHGRYRDAVERSLLTLKLLIYEPTGAIVAAPTTSLPEWVGGARNWDYRYSWVRDSNFILRALFQAHLIDEGATYFDWLLGQAMEEGPLQVMYGIRGERSLPERELPLRGYRDSRPVRIGNGADGQFQLDIYGALLDAALRYDRQGGVLSLNEWEALVGLAEEVRSRWREPDAGIWEARCEPRHYTYSKVWAWVALTRAAELGRQMGTDAPVDAWRREAEAIRGEVLERGWSDELGSFVQAYGSPHLDASLLVMPTVGFLRADDPRYQGTLRACRAGLGVDGSPLLFRYTSEDGVGGPEGAFLLPSFWAVEARALAGDVGGARTELHALMRYLSPLGLYAEEVEPETGAMLGNMPQGFSHLGLVNAIFRMEEIKRMAEGW
jgi:GH15 family glucan-1,4-alpha-glucosidase